MTNFEKYKDEILKTVNLNENGVFGINKQTNEFKFCMYLDCENCLFYKRHVPCGRLKFDWLYKDYKKTIVLDDFTKELLTRLYTKGYRYIVKEASGEVRVYENKPHKSVLDWDSDFCYGYEISSVAEFDFLSWCDDEPTSIKKLLGGKEND